MQELKELVQIISTNKLALTPTIFEDDQGKLAIFYQHIASQAFHTDEQAADFFYQENKDHAGYKKLKGTLKNRLVDAILLLDLDHFVTTPRQKAQCRCYKDWAAVKILMSKNANSAGISLCQRLLKRAKKYEFTELMMETTSLLRVYYGTLGGDLRKFEHYNQLFKRYRNIWNQENLAEELYTELVVRYVRIKANQPEIHAKAQESYELIAGSIAKYNSYRLQLSGNLIRLMIPSTANNYQQVNQLCDEVIRFFEAKEYVATIPLQIFWYQKIVCCMQLRQFEASKIAIERCLDYMDKGTFNWFKLQQLDILLSFHTRQYQQAYERFKLITNHAQYAALPEHFTETIRIYSAYLYYLSLIGKVGLADKDRFFQHFRIAKFANDTPIFSKDKRGMHIPILIIQILLLILDRKYGMVIDKIDAIEKYCSRYLRQDDTFRSNCFIKMLLQIPISNFHRVRVEAKTKELLHRLKEARIELSNQTHEVEIIPYEDLWEFALSSLNNTIYMGKSATASAVYRN